MSFQIQKSFLSAFIFIVITLILICSTHQISVSLIGSLASLVFAILTYIIYRYNVQLNIFIFFHLIEIALVLIFQTPEIIALAFFTFLLRESISLIQVRVPKETRTSLLCDLGVIKPKKQLFPVFRHSLPFIIASSLGSFLSSLIPLPSLSLAYFLLFLFAIGLGALIVEELSNAATDFGEKKA